MEGEILSLESLPSFGNSIKTLNITFNIEPTFEQLNYKLFTKQKVEDVRNTEHGGGVESVFHALSNFTFHLQC